MLAGTPLMVDSRANKRLSQVDQVSEQRLWKTLDAITEKVNGIDDKVSTVVRLEERVNAHDDTFKRYGNRLDNHENRIRDSELWQAHKGDSSSLERLVSNIQEDLNGVRTRLNTLESYKDIKVGKDLVSKSVFKWAVGILTTIIVVLISTLIKGSVNGN